MRLSVNLNKIALLRNARGNNYPSVEDFAYEALSLGVHGLTLHPRQDSRHATCNDAIELSTICKKNSLEFNLEGNPFSLPKNDFIGFYELCDITKPEQITLVPDSIDQITSDHGWSPGYKENKLKNFLIKIKHLNSRISLFINPEIESVEFAANLGLDRIEIYTGPFANSIQSINIKEIKTAISLIITRARELGLGVNAGHDLNLENLPHLIDCGEIDEVSIGHAIIINALKYGFHDTIIKYINTITTN